MTTPARLRSLLFVPGDRPERFAKAASSGADAIILDLEDSVAPDRKEAARDAVGEYVNRHQREYVRGQEQGGPAVLVRVNPLGSPQCYDDIGLLDQVRPDAILLPKAGGAASVTALFDDVYNCPPILPIATETPAAIFVLSEYQTVADKLLGLTWGAEDLPAAIGASTSREPDGAYTQPYELARSLTLFAAHAAGVPAIETVFPAFSDIDGLARYAERGARDGFTGMMAIHPAQVPVINRVFTPSGAAVADARAIVDAFAANPGAGVLNLNGRMIDAPHLKQARALLARAVLPLDGSEPKGQAAGG